MTEPYQPRIPLSPELAVELMKDISSEVWADVGSTFTCSEAEALVDLFLALGLTQHSETLLYWHAVADEECDMHEAFECPHEGCPQEGRHVHENGPKPDQPQPDPAERGS